MIPSLRDFFAADAEVPSPWRLCSWNMHSPTSLGYRQNEECLSEPWRQHRSKASECRRERERAGTALLTREGWEAGEGISWGCCSCTAAARAVLREDGNALSGLRGMGMETGTRRSPEPPPRGSLVGQSAAPGAAAGNRDVSRHTPSVAPQTRTSGGSGGGGGGRREAR